MASTSSMPPAVFVDIGFEAARHPPCVAVVGGVADRAGRTGSAARACVRAFPWLLCVARADPAAIVADGAFHRSHLICIVCTFGWNWRRYQCVTSDHRILRGFYR